MRLPTFSKKGGSTETDPVCNMDVAVKKHNGGTWDHNGETYYFCGPGCNRAFQKEPEAYLSGDKKVEM